MRVMVMVEQYLKQLRLLLEIMPYVFDEPCFCLKGGTAINLFILDFPRISVDIDLVYLPQNDRQTALQQIDSALAKISKKITQNVTGTKVFEKRMSQDNILAKLFVEKGQVQVIIEPNFVLRGHLYPIEQKTLAKSVQELVQLSLSDIPILNSAEVYAGKICAALDRQHPRDLFDIKLLYENGWLTKEIRQAFVIYLASGSRPMHELLNPNELDIQTLFTNEFLGMSNRDVTYDELLEARSKLIHDIRATLSDDDKEFLISVKQGEPKYELMPFDNLETFPALQWKIKNIKQMDKEKQSIMLRKLEEALR